MQTSRVATRSADAGALRTTIPELLKRGLDVAALFGGAYCYRYLMDEPERNLHPSVARKAARWLRQEMPKRQAQCVLTTHSAPFLDLGEATTYTYLWRATGKVFATQFDPAELRALDQLSHEMGFDRGELLTTVQQLLFVEGRADQVVLETLMGRELRQLGVAVIPMHGVGRLHRVVEPGALFRYTSASIRVLLDNDVAKLVPELQADPDKLEAALRKKKHTELQAVAQLIRTARQVERESELRVLSIPEPDMFFMLDENVVSEVYELYPGHAQAEAAWEAERRKTGQNIKRKRFRNERYQVPDELGLYEEVSARMSERGLVPAPLRCILGKLAEWSE